MEYASKSVGNAALTTGIIGTALGVLDGFGGIANLFGPRQPMDPGDRPVTRHEMDLYQQINAANAEIASLKGQKYTDVVANGLQQQLSTQAVWNATQAANLQCLQGQVAQLQGMTKLVIPNDSVMPGWGHVTVYPTPYPPYPPLVPPAVPPATEIASSTSTTSSTVTTGA